jgi:hypothetical protein
MTGGSGRKKTANREQDPRMGKAEKEREKKTREALGKDTQKGTKRRKPTGQDATSFASVLHYPLGCMKCQPTDRPNEQTVREM